MEEQPFVASIGGGGRDSAVPRSFSRTIAFSPPRTSLNLGDRWTSVAECMDPPLNAYDDPPLGDCGYSKPFIVLDVIWNLAFVLVSLFVLLTTIREKPVTPLRVWISGYALQCLLHVAYVFIRHLRGNQADAGLGQDGFSLSRNRGSILKRLESIKTIISSIWWVFGFYWIVVGGQALLQDSPRLYWLAVVFLGFDVLFMIFCVMMAFVVFFALVCFFPTVASIARAMTMREGASENDIRTLPKYKYRQANSLNAFGRDWKQESTELTGGSGSISSTPELALNTEDSECCICLYKYMEGAELCRLPCKHHFHQQCVSRWLRINATCPLCKFNISNRADALV
ncbi:hypothetical protein NMG60_11025670 [Bertholletia excelsa]